SVLLALLGVAVAGGVPVIAHAGGAAVGIVQQATTIKGMVVDESGGPIVGASVVVEGTSISTVTDENGSFTLANAPEAATLKISYLGYPTLTVAVAGQTT